MRLRSTFVLAVFSTAISTSALSAQTEESIGVCNPVDPTELAADFLNSPNSCYEDPSLYEFLKIDDCLVGAWRPLPNSYRDQLQASLTGKPIELAFAHLDGIIQINSEGIVSGCLDGEAQMNIQNGAVNIDIEGDFVGVSSRNSRGNICYSQLFNSVVFRTVTQIQGQNLLNSFPGGAANLYLDYSCSGDSMTITANDFGQAITHRFERVAQTADFNPQYCRQIKDACIEKCSDEFLETGMGEWAFRGCLRQCCREASSGRCRC